MKSNSSRERMLAALENKEPDYVPCSFMIFSALEEKCKDQFEFVERQLDLGLDPKVELPELPFRFHPQVKVIERKETTEGEEYSLLHKEYITPEGKLKTMVRKTGDWPYGDSVPLFNDYLVSRSKKFLIDSKNDINSLKYLFAEPTNEDISEFREESKKLKGFAAQKGLLISGGWKSRSATKGIDMDGGVMGGDVLFWLLGAERAIFLALDEPDLIEEILGIVSRWNIRRIEIYLDEGIDLLVRRAWYESTDFWSPQLYRKFFFPILKKEIEVVHQAGAKFGYIMTSGFMPLVDDFLELGIDVLIGIDPLIGKGTDMRKIKESVNKKICLWGGINGYLTIEKGKKDDVEKATKEAISILKPGGGFILSPVDNISEDSEIVWENIKTMINVWREERGYF